MAKSNLSTELARAIADLERFAPFSTHSKRRPWREALASLQNIDAVLRTIEAFRPGVLHTLEAAAEVELQVEHDAPIPAITALVKRYSSRRESLR